jgi:hypothetical protein
MVNLMRHLESKSATIVTLNAKIVMVLEEQIVLTAKILINLSKLNKLAL